MSRPLWRDGLFMMPQHFQLLDEHIDEAIDRRASAAEPFPYGVLELELDREALLRGLYRVRTLRAVMPDGLWVEIGAGTGVDELVASLGKPTSERLELHLAVPSTAGRGTPAYAAEAGVRGARFVRSSAVFGDAFGSTEAAEIELIRPNVQLLVGGEDHTGYVAFKLAELVRSETGTWEPSTTFAPPALSVRAAPALYERLQGLVTQLGAKRDALAQRYRHRAASMVEFGAADMLTFWYLYTLQAALPRLQHYARVERVHPERVYLALAELHGMLATFDPDRLPRVIPAYEHHAQHESFAPLFDQLDELLKLVLGQQARRVELKRLERGWYTTEAIEWLPQKKHQLYLVAQRGAGVDDKEFRENFPRYVRIAALDRIKEVVTKNVAGLRVVVELKPPTAIPVKPDQLVLRLHQEGSLWNDVLRASAFGLFQPYKPDSVTIDLLAVEA